MNKQEHKLTAWENALKIVEINNSARPATARETIEAFNMCSNAIDNSTSNTTSNTVKYFTPFNLEPLSVQNLAQQEKEKKMCYKNDKNQQISVEVMSVPSPVENTEASQRSYLKSRLYDSRSEKTGELRKKFHMNDDDTPGTPEELVKRIKDGQYEIKEKQWKKYLTDRYDAEDFDDIVEEARRTSIWNVVDYFTWRNPKSKKDEKGFEAAKKELDTAYTAAKDAIVVLTLAEGLKALQDFEANA